MELAWREVSVTVSIHGVGGRRAIISRCSGRVKVGSMAAVMGPSGCGKTTLLSALCQDTPHDGVVRYDGARFSPAFRQIIGFCEKDDVFLPYLTVRQSLMFYSQMRYGIDDIKARASVLETLAFARLLKVVDAPTTSLTRGERKCLCIARELVAESKILMCDEPTNGLEAPMAYQVMDVLRQLCDSGKVSVLLSVRQPTSKIFKCFDDLIVMRQGEMLFCGPASQAEHIFSSVGPQKLQSHSVAEYLTECLVRGEHEAGGLTPEMHSQLSARARRLSSALPDIGAPIITHGVGGCHAPFPRQVYLLTCRFGQQASKDLLCPVLLALHSLEMVIASLAWWQLGSRECDVRLRFTISNWIIAHWCFYGTQTHMFSWTVLRPHLQKELRAGVYSFSAVFLSRVVMTFPLEILWPTFWTTGVFWATRLCPSLYVWLQVVALTWLINAIYQALSLAVGSLSDHKPTVQSLVYLFLVYSFLWTSLYVDLNNLPGLLGYLQYGNPLWCAVTIMAYLIFPDERQFSCDGLDANLQGCKLVPVLGTPKQILYGAEARARHKIEDQMPPWLCLSILMGLLFFFWLVSFFALGWSLQHQIGCPNMESELEMPEASDDQHALSFTTPWAGASCADAYHDGLRLERELLSARSKNHRSSSLL